MLKVYYLNTIFFICIIPLLFIVEYQKDKGPQVAPDFFIAAVALTLHWIILSGGGQITYQTFVSWSCASFGFFSPGRHHN